MNLDNEFFRIPQEERESFYENDQVVHFIGKLKLSEFENEFKEKLSSPELSGEKAMHIGLLHPSPKMVSVASLLYTYIPNYR